MCDVTDMELLVKALKRIKEECEKHCYTNCYTCPMYCEDGEDGCLAKTEPSEWVLNENVTKVLLKPNYISTSEVAGNE